VPTLDESPRFGNSVAAALAASVVVAGCGAGAPLPQELETADQALTVCDAGATLQGADVSGYQGTVDWAQVADSGLSFSIAKATEGLTIQDADFPQNWAGMKANGLARGAYHYFHSLDDGGAQADAFLAEVDAAGGFLPGDLPPFLDWEDTDPGDTSAHAMLEAQGFLTKIQAQTGRVPVIYTSVRVWTALGDPSQFGNYPLWVASRGASCPDLPDPWSEWLFWQYSFVGTIPGMNCPGSCDLDEFNGGLAELRALGAVADGGGADAGADGGVDAGAVGDAGTVSDAGAVADAGTPHDGGTAVDAGPLASPDGGAPIADAGSSVAPAHASCGCQSGSGALGPLWLLAALVPLRRAKRKRLDDPAVTA
jgi:lysozyme